MVRQSSQASTLEERRPLLHSKSTSSIVDNRQKSVSYYIDLFG